jgi:hypothetical protein
MPTFKEWMVAARENLKAMVPGARSGWIVSQLREYERLDFDTASAPTVDEMRGYLQEYCDFLITGPFDVAATVNGARAPVGVAEAAVSQKWDWDPMAGVEEFTRTVLEQPNVVMPDRPVVVGPGMAAALREQGYEVTDLPVGNLPEEE